MKFVYPDRWYKAHKLEVNRVIKKVLKSGRWVGGDAIDELEHELAGYTSAAYAVACSSGTSALLLALAAIGIDKGDEVILSDFSFIASAEIVASMGATPVFVDIDAHTFNIDPEQVLAACTEHTKAVIATSMFGQAADFYAIKKLLPKEDIVLIDDCAQSLGCTYQGNDTGNYADISTFSFYPSKTCGTVGEGGAVVTSNYDWAERMEMIRNHGQSSAYTHDAIGGNYRISPIQAAVAKIHLKYLDAEIRKRLKIAYKYHKALTGHPRIIIPKTQAGNRHAWGYYTLRVIGQDRGQARQVLEAQGIPTAVYYRSPLSEQPCFAGRLRRVGDSAVTKEVCNQVISLPIDPYMTNKEVKAVIEEVITWI